MLQIYFSVKDLGILNNFIRIEEATIAVNPGVGFTLRVYISKITGIPGIRFVFQVQ